MFSVAEIEKQLKLRMERYPATPWGRKQGDAWDSRTKFVYRVRRWEQLEERLRSLEEPLANYAVNRWFNFWSAVAIERAFCALPQVQARHDSRDRLVDFSIQGINFDHKTSVFPRGYGQTLSYARRNEQHLIDWLYRNQSRGQRFHVGNRLFVVLHARDGEHWRLRARVREIGWVVRAYVTDFDPERLVRVVMDDKEALSDVIWFFG